MKKHNLLLAAGAVAVALGTGSAVAAPAHDGHHGPNHHPVVHVNNAPRPGHNNGHQHHHASSHHHHHHHHHHGTTTGDLIIATAILISAMM